MPDEAAKNAADVKAADVKAGPANPPVPSTPAPHPENKPPLVEQKTPPAEVKSPVTSLSPKAAEVSKKTEPGKVVVPPTVDRPSIDVNDLVDLLLFKGAISNEDVAALADPAIGGTTVHRADRMRYRFDPAFGGDVDKARKARLERANLIASHMGGPPKLDRSDEDLGDLAAAPPAALFRPTAT